MIRIVHTRAAWLLVLLGLGLTTAACSSSNKTTNTADSGATGNAGLSDGGMCTNPGEATPGAQDKHCGSMVTVVSEAACTADAGPVEPPELDDAGLPISDYGPTMYGMEGDDDDCKYHVVWTAGSLCKNEDIYFTVKLTSKKDGSVVKDASPVPDITLGSTLPADTMKSKSVEGPDGTYKVGPVRLSASGMWTVRFHFFETCNDLPASPHGHAAFFVTIPPS